MMYLATYNWSWLLIAALIGFAMGWIAVVQRGEGLSSPIMKKYAAFFAALVLASLTRVLPGRTGYWLDLGLVMFVVYLLGCTAGSWLRNLVLARGAPAA